MPTSLFRPARITAAAALAAALTVLPVFAEAHVRVRADTATPGAFSALTFRVPNESDTASTIKLSVELPTDRPFVYVSVKPVPGWKAVATEAKLPTPVESGGATITKAVRTVTWTATGDGIEPGEYQEFAISAGPLPEPGEIVLPTTQTYSDGKVSVWDEPTPANGPEPENPAPTLVVAEPAAATPPPAAPSVETAAAAADPVARGLGGVGLLLGAAGLIVALLGRRRATASGSTR